MQHAGVLDGVACSIALASELADHGARVSITAASTPRVDSGRVTLVRAVGRSTR